MADKDNRQRSSVLGFLDSLGRLLRSPEASDGGAQPPDQFAKLEAAFDAAIRDLNEKVAAQRRVGEATRTAAAPPPQTAGERAAERKRRMEAAHRAMRADIEAMHAKLGTGIAGTDLDGLAEVLQQLEAIEAEGKGSHELLPRARHAIAEKLRVEAGELAVARLVALLVQHEMAWPDPTRPDPSASPEEIERTRERRRAELRREFLAAGFARTADMLLGMVKGWGSDYPERGSPLWQATVLEGVAAGIRGRLLRDFVECVRRNRDEILRASEAAVGKQLEALHASIAGGVQSLEQASRAVVSTWQVVDEVIPGIAWERIHAELPETRGESA